MQRTISSGRPDIKDTIRRLQAYQDAGANVLYAPGLATREDIAAVVSSVDRPVNAVMGLQGVQLSLDDLSALGVKRVSVGSSLSRAALGAFLRAAAREMREHGTFGFAAEAVSFRELSVTCSDAKPGAPPTCGAPVSDCERNLPRVAFEPRYSRPATTGCLRHRGQAVLQVDVLE